MDLHFFLNGFLIGIAVSVPLGPLGMFCVRRTVNKNWQAGLFSGLGISVADSIYATMAGFSLTIIIDFIRHYEIFFKIFGLLILIGLGLYIFRSNPAKDVQRFKRRGSSYLQDFLSTFFITLSNPLSIFVFIAIFSSYSIVLQLSQLGEAFLIIAGIFFGGTLWWFILTGLANLFRHKFTIDLLEWANKIIGIGIITLALLLFFVLQTNGI